MNCLYVNGIVILVKDGWYDNLNKAEGDIKRVNNVCTIFQFCFFEWLTFFQFIFPEILQLYLNMST